MPLKMAFRYPKWLPWTVFNSSLLLINLKTLLSYENMFCA